MSEASFTPGVSMLHAFKRDSNTAGNERLSYPNLVAVASEAKLEAPELLDEFWLSEAGSIYEEERARAAATGNLVLTGAQLQRVFPKNGDIIADRMTQASIELYGAPNAYDAAILTSRALNKVRNYIDNPAVDKVKLERVISFFEKQVGGAYYEVSEEMDEQLLNALSDCRRVVEERFAAPLAVFDRYKGPKQKVEPNEAVGLVQEALGILADLDPAWRGWTAKLIKDSAWNTDSEKQTIGVGRLAREVEAVKSSFGHEAFGHALRAVNGAKTGNRMLEHGLPGYLDNEEGLGIFIQMALSGTRIARSSDIYMNIAFALGELELPLISRKELQSIYFDYLTVQAQANRQQDEDSLQAKAWTQINRVFRGSLGNETQVVSTKDIAYYQGFLKISSSIQEQRKAGKSMEAIFDFLTSAAIDPTNPRHIAYLEAAQR